MRLSQTVRVVVGGWLAAAFGGIAVACSAGANASPASNDIDASGVPEAAAAADGGAEAASPSCNGSPLRVFDLETPGLATRLYADLPLAGATAPFLIDMGTPHSFVHAPTNVPDAAGTTVSCVPITLPGFSGAVPEVTPDGDEVRGVVGVDLVARGALDIRMTDKKVVWWQSQPAIPADATVIPLELYEPASRLVASDVELDGQKVRLLLDTGAPHVLVLSETPRPNETPVQTADGNGDPVTLYMSTIAVAFGGGAPRTLPVARAAKFPGLDEEAAAMGFNGLLGLSALGHTEIVITKTSLAFVLSAQ